ncbi:probable aldo-keto reductase 1 [Euphorbia lathyris]|uniref:probable aldo-keto reductase 1 n=1 Tax=Euphorbia lathyris TaxID=212925 RepID=UPI003313DDB6
MAEQQGTVIPRVKLGTQGFEVSKLGFGCMGLSGGYNAPVSEEDGITILKEAFNRGITFFDTSDIYGPHTNELLLGKALKQLPRERIQLATKFGFVVKSNSSYGNASINGKPEYVRACCEASVKRLYVEYIDLYYQHRIDITVPIEETMGELKKLVEEGKIKYIGLSEASPDTIRRAHAVHPITALQMEWSLCTRDIEEDVVPLCRELGIGIVPYSPLGRGLFGGKGVTESLHSESSLHNHPRFSEENVTKNKVFYTRIEHLAKNYGCSPAQLALAWVLNQGDDVVPIPGTTKIKNLLDNIEALRIRLTKDEMKEISGVVPVSEVAGVRSYNMLLTYKFVNTPLPRDAQK